MKTNSNHHSSVKGINSAALVIVISFAIALLIYYYIFGYSGNFMNNDPNNYPLPGNILGTIYKGGIVVPVIQTLLLTVLILSVERWFAINKASGKGNMTHFVTQIKEALSKGDVESAQKLCNGQGGSLGNVVHSALQVYAEEKEDNRMTKEQKVVAIQKNIEEATSLELPSLEQNLPVIATITTLGTLMGLLGTVLGMIKAFSAMATAGSPDTIALSTGISEALVNTAFGIATGALAVISYNYFTARIDKITYGIDEAGFTIVQTFATSQK
ncbi:MAG: MotA/TolQ/ExbB proton channel family protein [Bacteroidales bacterium]